MKRSIYILLITSMLLYACGPSTRTPKTPVPVAVPITKGFEGSSIFTSGAGNYAVMCENCTATVVTTNVCETDITGKFERFTPLVKVSHNGKVTEGTIISSDNAQGAWVIVQGAIPYSTSSYRFPDRHICVANAVFTIIMFNGGTITMLP